MILSKRNFLKHEYKVIENFVNNFKIKDFNKKAKVKKYFDFFNLKILVNKKVKQDRIKANKSFILKNVIKDEKKPFEYELDDLCRLHWIILKKKFLILWNLALDFLQFSWLMLALY